MFRALALLRGAITVWTVARAGIRHTYDHPAAAWACIGVMAAWTVLAAYLYDAPERRGPALLLADLALAMAMLVASPIVKGPWFHASLPGYWIIGALIAWAIRYGWAGGLGVGVLLGMTDLLTRATRTGTDWGNLFLLMLSGSVVGFLCGSLQQMAAERDRAQRELAAVAERARLARAVHDGVLQVLALVQRRGAELGGEAAELGRLAGEQEESLRSLIRVQNPTPGGRGETDLVAALDALSARPGVEVALPAGSVTMPTARANEVLAVVSACLDNVSVHVGPGAPAWVFLEDLGDEVGISVRDEGPGIPEGRLEEAEREGRMGVSGSIRGRVADLGGRARLRTGATGTDWELVVPKIDEEAR